MNADVEARAAELRRDRVAFVHARVVRAERPTSAKPGDEAVVLSDGTIEGFVGGQCAESTVRAQSLSLLDSGESLLLRIAPEGGADGDPGPGRGGSGSLTVVNPCLSGGTLEIFLEPVVPASTIGVHGESPIAAALVALAEHVGFRATQLDPSPEGGIGDDHGLAAVVVASHGRDEEEVLEAAIRARVPYVALVASRRRGEDVVAALDLDDEQRASIHTPAGLDIGARTPREVALSILAEIVALRPRPPRGAAPAPAAAAGAGAGERPDVATDLVCGMTVVADDATLHLDHEGARYWFCGTGCLRAFAADPSTYLP
ncbi:MAG TPA: XdhC family protein [Acidimicrobiales bacterium]|nr:XdhC family protein [Acidimicrobiales bacterium]